MGGGSNPIHVRTRPCPGAARPASACGAARGRLAAFREGHDSPSCDGVARSGRFCAGQPRKRGPRKHVDGGMSAKRESHAAGLAAGAEAAGCTKRAKLEGAHTTANRREDVEDVSWSTIRDDLDVLKRLQKLNAVYDPRSSAKYVSVRRLLVDFIFSVGEELQLQTITIHRSVNYLDRLLTQRTDLSRALYQLLATACILVAGLFSRAARF